MRQSKKSKYTNPDVVLKCIKSAIGIFICLLLALYTGNKLRRMFVIRGTLEGGSLETVTISQKFTLPGRHGQVYWIAWKSTKTGKNDINLDKEVWSNLTIGDKIEITYLDGDTDPYYAGGIYASKGNVIFDIVLLMAELFGIGYFTFQIVSLKRSFFH